jgi:hypothetical protein
MGLKVDDGFHVNFMHGRMDGVMVFSSCICITGVRYPWILDE